MSVAARWLFVAMIVAWFLASCSGGSAMWMRWALLGAALPALLVAWWTGDRLVAPSSVVVPLGGLIGYGLLSSLASKATGLAVAKTVAFGATSFACILGGTVLVERFGRDRVLASWRWVWRVFLGVCVAGTALGAWPRNDAGLYGPTGNPNMFGSLLVSLGAILFLPPREGRRREAAWYVEVVAGLGLLLLTRCRSTMLGLAVASVVLVLAGRGTRRWLWTAAVLVVGGALLVATPRSAIEHVEGVVRKTPMTDEGSGPPDVLATRLPIWELSWDAMLHGLPLGFGWGVKEHAPREWSFDVKSLGYGREEGTSWLPVGEELGLPGLVLVAWLWLAAFRSAGSQSFRVCAVALAGLTSSFVVATFEGWFLTPGNWESMAFWTSVGILLARPATSFVGRKTPAPAGAPLAIPAGAP